MGGSRKKQTFKVGLWNRVSNNRNVLFKIGESADIQSELSSKTLLLIVRVRWDHLGFPVPGFLDSLLDNWKPGQGQWTWNLRTLSELPPHWQLPWTDSVALTQELFDCFQCLENLKPTEIQWQVKRNGEAPESSLLHRKSGTNLQMLGRLDKSPWREHTYSIHFPPPRFSNRGQYCSRIPFLYAWHPSVPEVPPVDLWDPWNFYSSNDPRSLIASMLSNDLMCTHGTPGSKCCHVTFCLTVFHRSSNSHR